MTPQEKTLIEFARFGDIDGVKTALIAGADAHANNDAALRGAALNGHAEIVSRLLAAGANVHANNDEALCWAALNGHAEIVSWLLAAGADIHADHDDALRWAAASGHAEVVRILLAAGADPAVALKSTLQENRSDAAATLDACAAVLSQDQRTALLDISRPGEFVRLRAIVASAAKHRAVRR